MRTRKIETKAKAAKEEAIPSGAKQENGVKSKTVDGGRCP